MSGLSNECYVHKRFIMSAMLINNVASWMLYYWKYVCVYIHKMIIAQADGPQELKYKPNLTLTQSTVNIY